MNYFILFYLKCFCGFFNVKFFHVKFFAEKGNEYKVLQHKTLLFIKCFNKHFVYYEIYMCDIKKRKNIKGSKTFSLKLT